MSNEKTRTQADANSTLNWYGGLTDSFRDLFSIQVRTAQVIADRSLGLSQTWTDFVQNQMHEGMKISQECVKYGMSLTENVKKSAFEMSDRAMRTPTT
jgi:hypothetical protein